MKDALSRIFYLIHWIVFILFVFAWVSILAFLLDKLFIDPYDNGFIWIVWTLKENLTFQTPVKIDALFAYGS